MHRSNGNRIEGKIDAQGIITAQFSSYHCAPTYVWRKQS
jgi:hypothetical protein